MTDAPRLIETLLWDGAACPRLAGHMERLAMGAGVLGYPCDRGAAVALIDAAAPVGLAARLRLTLGAGGDLAIETAPLPATKTRWKLGLAPARQRSDDPWLRVKSTRRAAYDAARAALPPDLDEVVFQNERGEVCDGTITTLFFDRGDGQMRTPPLSSGLLPGVLRAELLASGCAVEEVLFTGDLPQVRLWLGNALRGLIAADWAGGSAIAAKV